MQKISYLPAELIAKIANGSYRDAYGTLQKAITISKDKKLDYEEISKALGLPKIDLIKQFIEGYVFNKPEESLQALSLIRKEGSDPQLFFSAVCDLIRMSLVSRIAKESIKKLFPYAGHDEIELADDIQKRAGEQLSSLILIDFLEFASLSNSLSDPFTAYEALVLKKVENNNL